MNKSFFLFLYYVYPLPFSFLQHLLFIQVVKRSQLLSHITKSIVLVSVKRINKQSLNRSNKSPFSLKAISNKPHHHYNLMENQNPKKKLPSGHQIPYIGYGTYQLKGEDCTKGVRWALQTGYTHIDTATIYRNEEEIGKLLKDMQIDRSQIFITSKISPAEQGYQETLSACEQILKRLQIQYLDLLIIHWPGISKADVKSLKNKSVRHETWRALIELQAQGKVRDIGVSNFLKHHLVQLLKHFNVKPAVNQFQIHPLLWEGETIQYCRKENIVIEAYSPLARNDQRLFGNEIIKNIAQKYNKTVAQVALRWSYQHQFIILPKSKTQNRIKQNFNVFDFNLTQEEMDQINLLTKLNVRTCWDPNAIIY